jgi:hypothetical protein
MNNSQRSALPEPPEVALPVVLVSVELSVTVFWLSLPEFERFSAITTL